jgi:hypothetical protein
MICVYDTVGTHEGVIEGVISELEEVDYGAVGSGD